MVVGVPEKAATGGFKSMGAPHTIISSIKQALVDPTLPVPLIGVFEVMIHRKYTDA